MPGSFDGNRDDPPEAKGAVGYRHPPAAGRFQKGQSGNPKGRPRGKSREAPYEAVLGQIVTIRDGAVTREVTLAEAFLLHVTKQALEGGGSAARSTMAFIEAAEADRAAGAASADHQTMIVHQIVTPGSVTLALEPLRMARKLDPYRETARMALEPWIVEAALARMGDRRLSREDQAVVVKATRTPNKVKWPDWWEVRG